jgi:hypothetical protein
LATPGTFSGTNGEMRVALLSAASRWLNGGDYMGLATDTTGRFHPVWADARSGTYQVYTARVEIQSGSPTVTLETDRIEVTDRIELVNDPGSYDAKTKVLNLWIRLKNTSARPIFGPIEVEIRKFGSGMGGDFANLAPEVLNASNGVKGVGARFVYDEALGTERMLADGVSGAVLWQLRLQDPRTIPDLHVFVTGNERRETGDGRK